VQSKRGDDQRFLDTAWTLQLLRSLVLAVIAVAISWPMASFLEVRDPAASELRLLLPFVAFNMLIDGLQSMKLRTATRHLKVKATVCIELVCQFVSAATCIVLAFATRSVYALPIGGLVSSLLMLALSHWALAGPGNRLRWDRESVRELLSFGQWILFSTIVSFLALQLDRFVFSAVFPLREVGVYSIAAGLGIMVPSLMGKLQSTLAMPLYARMLGQGASMSECLARTRRPLASLGGYMVTGVIACSPALIAAAYDDRYRMAGVYLPILASGAWFAGLEGTYGAAFLALGKAKLVAMVNVTKVTAFALLLWPCIQLGGLLGAVIALAAADAIRYVAIALVVWKHFGAATIWSDLRDTALVAVVAAAVLFGGKALADAIGLGPLPLLIAQMIAVTLAFLPYLLQAKQLISSSRASGS
jgi:O-antigen/teichoic acid export membrane protein